jgi:hypothetical protein
MTSDDTRNTAIVAIFAWPTSVGWREPGIVPGSQTASRGILPGSQTVHSGGVSSG